MQKLITVNGIGYPVSKLNKVEPVEMIESVQFGTLNEDFTVAKTTERTAIVDLYFDGQKAPLKYELPLSGQNGITYLPTDPEFLGWIEDKETESGKSASKLFKGALAKVAKIKALMKDVEERKATTAKLVEEVKPVVEQAVQTATPIEISQTEGENGVSLEVALKDLTDEPELPFTSNIVVQPELKTDALMANEELLQFNNPTVSDEDVITLQKKTKFITKWCNKYLSELDNDEESISLVAKRGAELDDGLMEAKVKVLALMEQVL